MPDKSIEEKITLAMRRCVLRHPVEDEIAFLNELYEAEHKRFSNAPKLATKFLNDNSQINVSSVKDPSHLAALSIVTSVLLNLDETINY